MSRDVTGECMCGAIKVRGTISDPVLRACHCSMCRKQTSSMFMSLKMDQDSIVIDGNVTIFASSEWARRGFCGTCGSTIFYGSADGQFHNLAAGLFENAGGAPLKYEFYEDLCPGAYALTEVGQDKMTTQQTLAMFAPDEGDSQ